MDSILSTRSSFTEGGNVAVDDKSRAVEPDEDAMRRRRQGEAVRGMARIPLSAVRSELPVGLEALYADVTTKRSSLV
jgi:hypothetical protein